MQRSFSLLSFQKLIIQSLFLSFLIIGCNFSKKEIDNKIIITGESETQDIQDAQEVLFLKDQFEYHRTNVNNNRFKFDLESNEVSTLEFSITMFLKFPIFAKPGDSIHVEFNEIDLKNETAPPIFSGARIVENNFFYELHQILKYKNSAYHYFYNCTETEFLNKIDSLNHLGRKIIATYQSEPNSDIECEKSMKDFLKYNLAYYVESYHSLLKNSFGKEIKGKSERFLSYQKGFFSDDSLLLNNSAYGSFLTKKFYNDIINQTSLEGEQSQKKNWAEFKVKEKFELADLEFDNKAKKEFIKFHILYSQIDWTGVISERDIENFEQTNPNAKYLKVIKDKFSQIPKILREEMILPDYTFFDKNDEERSLSDFKGKILYINVWASWCGPCLERRSYFEAIIKDFENEKDEIEFLSISLDRENEKEKWKNVIEKKNYRGIQLIAKDAFKSEICKDLKINMIPRFILVGRDGELIESQAPAAIHSDIRRTLADLILKS